MPYDKLLAQRRIKPYRAKLQEVERLLLHKGFRPRGPEQHRTVVRFCELTLDPGHKHWIALFDQMRRKRNRLVYESVGLVSRQEVEQALAFAGAFVEEIRLLVTGQPRLKLGGE